MTSKLVSDIDIQNQIYGSLLRSTVQHAYIKAIQIPPIPKNYFFFTAKDIPGQNELIVMDFPIPILADEFVQYIGEPIGIIVGPDVHIIQDIKSKITIEYEEKESLEFAEKFSASQIYFKKIIHKNSEENEQQKKSMFYETSHSLGAQDYYYAEPLGAIATIVKNNLEIYTASQWPFHVKITIANVANWDMHSIKINATDIGESIDGKIWYPSLVASYAAIASVLTKKPVKIIFTRQENFLYTNKIAPIQFRYRTALNPDNSISTMHIRILINSGAYSPCIQEILERIMISSTGFYAIPFLKIEAYAIKTNYPPFDSQIGFNEGTSFFALENHITELINQNNFDPIEWRLQNIKEHKHQNINVQEEIESGIIQELLTQALKKSDFNRKYSAYKLLSKTRRNIKDGPLKGVAVSIGYQGNGFIQRAHSKNKYVVEVTMDIQSRVTIKTEFQSKQSTLIFKEIAATILEIDKQHISFTSFDSSEITRPEAETLSTNLAILAPLLEKCCTAIQKMRFREALPITVKKEYKTTKKTSWDEQDFEGKPFINISPAICITEVEVNPINYEPLIKTIWINCSTGKPYVPQRMNASIMKQVPIAISRVLNRPLKHKKGKLVIQNSSHFNILHPKSLPKVLIDFVSNNDSARGIDTIGINVIPASITNAISMITHKQNSTIPIESKNIYEDINEQI